ncbi:MAG: ABC transporter ATP-binding protein [Lachnospiraceae bacterium]|nr:ABC transporter ATP-binding protein [Lachnospiraceae bacterium]
METLKFGFRYWKRNMPGAVFTQIISFLAIIADLMIPMLSGILLNYIIKGEKVEDGAGGVFAFLLDGTFGEVQTFRLFFHVAAVYGIFILVRIILIYTKNTVNQHLGLNLETDLRMATFHKLMELDSATVSEYNSGELLQIINSDTIMFKEMFCRMIPSICDSVFVLGLTIYLLSTINVWFILIPVVLLPFLVVTLMSFRKKAKENFRKIRECDSKMNLTVQENIEAVRLVRSFTNEALERSKFDETNQKVKETHIGQIWLSSRFEVVFNSIKQIAYIGTIAIGAVLVMKGYMLVGYIATCSAYVMKIMDHITQINNMLFQMQQQIVAGQKMKNFMEYESRIPDKGSAEVATDRPDIRLTEASVVIDGQKVLDHVSIDIPYGKKLGIVGGTGSGKSVLLKSLVRIHDLSDGSLTIDGRDIREYSLKNLRSVYSYVFQDVFLFSNTVDSNIAYGEPEIEEDYVRKAAVDAQAHSFITELSDGYKTVVGERGLGISGGQKQRVSIARALLKNAPVLVFDDSTSALDVNTEKKLLETVNQEYGDKTVIITAHRMSSVVDCDEIIYMKDGKITERGTFAELMALQGDFAEVYNIQQAQRQQVMDFDAMAAEGGVR